MFVKFGTIGVFVFIAFCGFKILYDDGIVGQTKKPLHESPFAVKGCFCHGDSASPRVHVWISGPESLAAGVQALYKINVAKDSSIAAGFDVAAFFGDLHVHDSTTTQLMRIDEANPVDSLELTHIMPKLALGHDTVSWSFWYRAPLTPGIIDTIYANGNSVDTSADPSGDYWNFAQNFLVRVGQLTSVRNGSTVAGYHLLQNYPNPFNPSTTIRYEIPAEAKVTLMVFDLSGKEVRSLVNAIQSAGVHEIAFGTQGGTASSQQLASGVYLYRISVQPISPSNGQLFVDTRKMILLK